MATGMMVDGQWLSQGYVQDAQGRFLRNPTTFRHRVGTVEANRYHLYVSYACPWAHRTLIMRSLKGLKNVLTVSVVSPLMLDDGWTFADFPGVIPDEVNGVKYLRDIYAKADSHYTGRVTVPILWDKKNQTIVNNESQEILRMLDLDFAILAESKVSFYPEELREEIDKTIAEVYQPINNGVYRAGFATSQVAYNEAVTELFAALEYWNKVLEHQRYLCGDSLTEADICMFTTLLRFDPVYYVHFKCNLQHIWDYPYLWRYLKDIYHLEGVAETCNFEHIKHHYYRSHPHINPSGIVPAGPIINLT